MALEKGSIGKTSYVTPLSRGFIYKPYDEAKHGLDPELQAALEQGLLRERYYRYPPGMAPPTVQAAYDDYAKNGDPLIRLLEKRFGTSKE